MFKRTFKDFTSAYLSLAEEIRDDYDYITSPRGMKVKEKLGVKFEITNPRHRIPYVPIRKFKIQYMIAETLWYLSANNKTKWIANYAPFWEGITDDGLTANSAYGARIFQRHDRIALGGINQWVYAKEVLKQDPDSRRAFIHIRTPHDSIIGSKDVPCTIGLQFFIRDNKLDLIVNMRSSDLILGISYDVPAFTFLQELMALELGVSIGTYIHISNSMHVYEKHFEMLDEILDKRNVAESILLSYMRGPMKSMPKQQCTIRLYKFEELLRSCYDIDSIDNALSDLKDIDDYWFDWAQVLAAHRAGKLGKKKKMKDLMYNVTEQLRPIKIVHEVKK
jgi:thymidylate synthase